MLTTSLDIPLDNVLGSMDACLQPETVLEACREQLDRVDAGVRASWREARFIEALYHPGRYLRAVFALLEDPETPAERVWPEGQLVYLHLPARKPMSRRGTLINLAGTEVEAYRFPNDRRLRGLRRFTNKRDLVQLWQGWIDQAGGMDRLCADTLQRLLYRYVPEQKWIVRCRIETVGAKDQDVVKRRIAVRATAPDVCRALVHRHTALGATGEGRFRIPQVVGADEAEGLIAIEWWRGQSLLETLKKLGEGAVMPEMVARLRAFHATSVDDLPVVARDDLLSRVWHAVDDISSACPEMVVSTETLAAALTRRIEELPERRPVTLHNDFHWNQVTIKRDRWTLLDLERMAQGDPLIDVATFVSQIEMLAYRPELGVNQATADRWASAFLAEFVGQSGQLDVKSLQTYAAMARLELARGMMRHLRGGWRALVRACVERAHVDLRSEEGITS